MAGNRSLNKASKAKEDEFYTQLDDIFREVIHYRDFFRGKVVFCNCDDPYESNFFKFFASQFKSYGLKKLIATCYAGSPIAYKEFEPNLFCQDAPDDAARKKLEGLRQRKPYKIVITDVPDLDGDGRISMIDVDSLLKTDCNVLSILDGDGDFRSDECVALLKEADVVVTNPPFSLFREFVSQLIEHNKHFLVVGNQNALTYKEIFKHFMGNRIWAGFSSGNMNFAVPEYYEPRQTRYWEDENGQKWRSLGNIMWFTNIDHRKRHEKLDFWCKYSPEKFPKYDNYDAINVDTFLDIPGDYNGVMGVPVTFLDKYNPEQFELLGCTESEGKGASNGLWDAESGVAQPMIGGVKRYKRIFIRHKGLT